MRDLKIGGVMLGGLYIWARQIIVFLLVTELFSKLAGEKYRKYLKLAVGLCLVFLVAAPVLRRLSGTDFAGLFKGAGLSVEFPAGGLDGDDAFRDGVLKEYEELVKRQLSEVLYGMELSVQKVQLWRTDGIIDGMTVWVKQNEKEGETKKAGRISITEIVIALDREEENSREGAVLEFVAQMRIADFYDMDVSHINVIKEE